MSIKLKIKELEDIIKDLRDYRNMAKSMVSRNSKHAYKDDLLGVVSRMDAKLDVVNKKLEDLQKLNV